MLAKFDPNGVAIPPNLPMLRDSSIKNNSGLLVLELITKVRWSLPQYFPAKPAAESVIVSVALGINHRQNITPITADMVRKIVSLVESCSLMIKVSILAINN
jgi:hypothetical protein